MRRIAAVLLIVVATASYAEKIKPSKEKKDKRFEAVTAAASSVAGSYRGPSESYGLVLELSPDGTLRGNYVEMGSVAVLNAIRIEGDQLTARASFDDGSSRILSGSFANRVLNGRSAFGLRLRAVPVEGLGPVDTFFEKL